MLNKIKKDLDSVSDKKKAAFLAGFFKTGKGQYGEGDVFLGITVPELRKISKNYTDASLDDIALLLDSTVHEHRSTALMILVAKYNRNPAERKKIVDFYLSQTKFINNWDLVDGSAPYILGDFLLDKDRSILYKLAKSKDLWEKRISIVSTLAFIRNKQLDDTFRIAELLLGDSHDLIHKAVGWMLREAGKRDQDQLEVFLRKHYKTMPRTMLRYAIERLDPKKKTFYMRRT